MNLFTIYLVFVLLYLLFIIKAGKVYPILYLFLFIYFIQYIYSVYLIYNEYPVLAKQMPIGQDELFGYVLPAIFFLFSGVFIFNRDLPIAQTLKKIDRNQARKMGNFLLVISYSFDLLLLLRVPGIESVVSFTYYMKFIGAMCYLFAPSLLNYFLIVLVYVGLAQRALGGVFIDFFIWSTYLFLMVSLRYSFSLKLRLLFIVLALPVLVIIQSVKSEYRDATWSGKRQAEVGLIRELAEKKAKRENDPLGKSDGVVRTVGRLNQGWHLGKVLKWVPSHREFANGEDLLGDIQAAILPRFFFPNKKMGGTQDKFLKYTGYRLEKDTSMTIGVLGDFYINFGRVGSYIALFIVGAIIARLFHAFVSKYVLPDPINLVWIPFLFSYLIRANNDFYFIFNNFVKGFLIFLIVNFLRKSLWEQPRLPR